MTQKKTKKPKLTGELARTIRWTGPKVPAADVSQLPPEERERWQQAYVSLHEQRCKKLPLVAQRYGIPLNDKKIVLKMLYEVCNEFFRGFHVDLPEPKQKGGRPIEWGFERVSKLLNDVDAVKKEKSYKQRKALRELVENRIEYHRRSGETVEKAVRRLENRLLTIKKFWGDMVEMLK
jgi:hypothetical protein